MFSVRSPVPLLTSNKVELTGSQKSLKKVTDLVPIFRCLTGEFSEYPESLAHL